MKKWLFALLVTFTLTLVACSNEVEVNDFDYPFIYDEGSVTQVETDGRQAVMRIVVDGFGGDINVMITVEDNIITDYEVTSHEESDGWGRVLIEDTTFIQDIIDNSTTLDDIESSDYIVDAEAGATAGATAQALIDAAKIARAHYIALYDTAADTAY